MWKKHFISEEEAFYNGCPGRTQNIAIMELVKDSLRKGELKESRYRAAIKEKR